MSDVNLMAEKVTEGSHTPGPWTYRDKQDREEVWIGVPGQTIGMKVIATVQYGFTPPADLEQKANTRLIAAAPELLQGMKDLYRAYVNLLEAGRDRIATYGGQCDSVETMERGDPWLKKARDVVAKAEGRS